MINGFGQTVSSIAVSYIDTKDTTMYPPEMGNLYRLGVIVNPLNVNKILDLQIS